MVSTNGKPRAGDAGPRKSVQLDGSNTSKITTAANPSSFNRQPARIDTRGSWHAHYWRDELVGSIRLTSYGAFEIRNRLQQPIHAVFPTWDAAAAALERGRP
jgi:hypothetical protein